MITPDQSVCLRHAFTVLHLTSVAHIRHIEYDLNFNETGELRLYIRGASEGDPIPWDGTADTNESVSTTMTTTTTTTASTTDYASPDIGNSSSSTDPLDDVAVPDLSIESACHIELRVGAKYQINGLKLETEGEKEVSITMNRVAVAGPVMASGPNVALWTQAISVAGPVDISLVAGTVDLAEIELVGQ